VDYDSQREFDASNRISVQYLGRPGETIQKIEVGNVAFLPPQSRFITTAIPSGNYGVLAQGQVGKFDFQALAAQQKGRVVKSESFTIGGRALRAVKSTIEDYSFEPRRFFFTVDPEELNGYPNIDILNAAQISTRRR
jgi:cell surface protein SprA